MRLRDIIYRTFYLVEHNSFDKIIIVLIFGNMDEKIKLQEFIHRQQLDINKIGFITGYIDSNDTFSLLEEIN